MSRSIQIQNHPFRFLLYLEWILLIVAAFSEATPYPFRRFQREPLLMILTIASFGLMGLRLPTDKQITKILYTSLEFFLILLTVSVGGIRLFPLLYIVLVIRSCLIFPLPGRLLITGLSYSLFLFTLLNWVASFERRPQLQERLRYLVWGYSFLFGLSLAFVLLLMNALLTERQSREKLAAAHAQLRQYALRIESQATLQERNRIARDIHDSLGHSLTALNVQLETAVKLWSTDPKKAATFMVQAKRLGSTALQDVRHSVSAMRADPLQGKSLEEAIASLALEFQRSTNISPICNIYLGRPLPPELNNVVYRIVQEALTNITKYAEATEVIIRLQALPTQLILLIQDDGKGFDLKQNTTGFGLQGMRERTLAQAGQFELNSMPKSGCIISAKFPLPKF
ncbi:MAG: sensor histidine kinase [Coleofasciculaceae cyanobacterium]